jgi:uncharacterized membrane protein
MEQDAERIKVMIPLDISPGNYMVQVISNGTKATYSGELVVGE